MRVHGGTRERRQQKRSLALILWCVLSPDQPQDELLCFICDLEYVGNVSGKIHYLDAQKLCTLNGYKFFLNAEDYFSLC